MLRLSCLNIQMAVLKPIWEIKNEKHLYETHIFVFLQPKSPTINTDVY